MSNATAINITTDVPPGLVAFREGATGPWQAATMKTSTTFEADVHGPYVVAAQCTDHTATNFSTTELAQTPDDPHDVMMYCDSTAVGPTAWGVTGQMVQPGDVWFDGLDDSSATASWSYNLGADTGTYDLMAVTATDIAFRRALDVHADLVVTPAIDMTHEGAALVATAFSVTNAVPGESIVAYVNLDNATLFDAQIYRGPLATALVAPDSQLVATDKQSASMQATVGVQSRALRQPFHAGDNAAYTLPPQSDLALAVQSGQLVASWTTLLPDFDTFSVYASGYTNTTSTFLDLEMTPAFATATHATQLVLDTDIPGYKTAQGIDYSGPYVRSTYVQKVANNVVTTTWSDENLNGAFAGGTKKHRTHRP